MGDLVDDVVSSTGLGLLGLETDFGGEEAQDAARDASRAQVAGQERALDYQIEQDRQPSYYRQQALDQLGGFYGLPSYQEGGGRPARPRLDGTPRSSGGAFDAWDSVRDKSEPYGGDGQPMEGDYIPAGDGYSGQGMIDDVMASPFYGSMVSQGEDAASRLASQQGLRGSGNLESRYVQNSQNVLQNLVGQRLQGLTGMANLPSNTNAIAGGMQGIGTTQAQGIQAQAQAGQQADQNMMGMLGTIGGAVLGGPIGASFGSQAGNFVGGAPSYQAPATNPMQNYYGNVV